ncbi:MAG: AzlD domain-containing protein [Betaproteobacteria bacterium]
MSGLDGWLTVIFCGLVTLAIRASFIVLPPDTQVPTWLRGGLKYVAAAVLPALIAPDVLYRELVTGEIINVYRVAAALLAMLVAYTSRSILGTLATGMAVLWLLKWWSPL